MAMHTTDVPDDVFDGSVCEITVYHGGTADGRLVHFTDDPDHVTYAYHYLGVADWGQIWRENNVVDGWERPVIHGTRSMMVGDIVQIRPEGNGPTHTVIVRPVGLDYVTDFYRDVPVRW